MRKEIKEINKVLNLKTKKILILEPHLDDFEIGLSVWLKKMAPYPLEIHIVTFCKGRTDEDNEIRKNKRLYNLSIFKREYPNIIIHNWNLGFEDTKLDNFSISHLINKYYSLMEGNISDYVQEFDFFKEILFTQKDLHPDHCIVNKIGKILTRTFKGKVFEYLIQNSIYTNEFKFNTEIKAEFNLNDKRDIERFIEVGIFPGEKIYFQQLIHKQKNFDGKYISDRLNLIKDTFVVSDWK